MSRMLRSTCALMLALVLVAGCSLAQAGSNPTEAQEQEAVALYEQAVELFQAGELLDAAQLMTQAIILDPYQPPFRFVRAQIALEYGDLETALQDCNIVLAFVGSNETVEELLAYIETQRDGAPLPGADEGDEAGAEAAFYEAVDLYANGDVEAAFEKIGEALAFSPNNSTLYQQRGGHAAGRVRV